MAGGLNWHGEPRASAILPAASATPSTSREYFQPPAHWLRAHHGGTRRPGRGCRRPANHWESAFTWRPSFELARGWLRQLDTTRDDIFYDDENQAHPRRLQPLAAPQRDISYVAPARMLPLDYSSMAERRLILSAPSYLDLRWTFTPLADLCGAKSPALVEPMGAAAAHTLWVRAPELRPSTSPAPGDFLVPASTSPPTGPISRGAGCLLRHGPSGPIAHASHPASSGFPPTSRWAGRGNASDGRP